MRILQMERHYRSVEDGEDSIHLHPHLVHSDLPEWHPRPSTLLLTWSHSGKWVRIPKIRDAPGGPDYHSFKIGRIEKYVDVNGVIREAVAYGDEDEKLMVWYRVEDMHAVMRWIIPEESPWVNSRKWVNEYKRFTNSKKSERGARGAPRSYPRGRGGGYENRGGQSYRKN